MKPTKEEFDTALDAAERMWQRDLDPHHLARVIRYLYQRNQELEGLLTRADRLVRFGMAERELAALKQTINRLREEDADEADSEINTSMLL